LKPGVQPAHAISEMNAGIAEFARRFAIDIRATLIPLQDQMTAGARSGLWLLLGTVGAVLLIACVNVGNLMLVRTSGRYREAGLRMALGASRANLFGLVLKEALVLVVVGGALGLLIAYAGVKLFVAAAPIDLPRLEDVHLDWRVLAFACAAALLSALLCGLFPAWRLAQTQPQESIKAGASNATEGGRKLRLRELMVSVEVALSTVLLIAGGLLMLSFFRLMRVDKGFRVERVITQNLPLTSPKYRQEAAQARFIDEVIAKLDVIPGVSSVAVTNQIPLRGETMLAPLSDPGQGEIGKDTATASFRLVSPGYWKTLGIPLRQGRFFEDADRNRAVVVLNERAAQQLWPHENPLGRHVRHVIGPCNGCSPLEVVGIVGDTRDRALAQDPPLTAYEPYWEEPMDGAGVIVRTRADPAAVIGAMRAAIRSVDPEIPIGETRTMERILEESVALRRFQMDLAAAFAMAALVLASLGIYGVVSFSVARRTPEMGIRIALGARGAQLVAMVVKQGMLPVLLGLAGGLACALSLGRFLASQLYGIVPNDPLTISAVAALLLIVALCACWIPARRATRIDPMRALRCE
jgi:predicted permease